MKAAPADVEVTLDPTFGDYRVEPVWAGVDRPRTGGWSVRTRADAERLERAIRAGVVFADARVVTDVNGQTYIQAERRVMGKYFDADLRALGF